MKLGHTLAHLLTPRPSNNFRAKLLHIEYLATLALVVVIFKATLSSPPVSNLGVLGYAANIDPAKVVEITNTRRVNSGLNPLTINTSLEKAALNKGLHMIEHDYWAHVAPDGTEPWDFFEGVGYDYRYAGENLARDFSNPSAAVDAWMASPTHRDNMLSSKFSEIGIAVVEGDLDGADTTIIVQLFGVKSLDTIPTIPVASANIDEKPSELVEPTLALESATNTQDLSASAPSGNFKNQAVSPFSFVKVTSMGLVALLGIVLVVDVIIISQKNVARASAKPLAHISFLSMVILLIWLARSGQIL